MRMQKLEYQVRFVTPAFLGNAEQSGQWRTPPFKALLRQWWRIVKAGQLIRAGVNIENLHTELLEREQILGYVAPSKLERDEHEKARRSAISLRLSKWNEGSLKNWKYGSEAEYAYLGFGPLLPRGMVNPPAIDSGDEATLTLIFPSEFAEEINSVMALLGYFGTVGGRSRNGWGSISLKSRPANGSEDLKLNALVQKNSRSFVECLKLKWPHQFGTDSKGLLIWQTGALTSWQEAIRELTTIKKEFRSELSLGRDGKAGDRHVLAYPITKNAVDAWGKDGRLANQLRFKVNVVDGKYVGLIFHLPGRLPEELERGAPELNHERQVAVWKEVHNDLDRMRSLSRATDLASA